MQEYSLMKGGCVDWEQRELRAERRNKHAHEEAVLDQR